MKKMIFPLALLLVVVQSFAQDAVRANTDRDRYLQKSRRFQTTGWLLLSGGAVATTIGAVVINNNTNSGDFDTDLGNAAGGIMAVSVGAVAMAGSIPFFVFAHAMKRKAARLSFNNQRILVPQQNSFVMKIQPALTLSISL